MILQSITLKYVFKRLASNSLLNTLKSDAILKSNIIKAAQKIYNDWDQDKDGIDDIYGGGGICDEISKAICDEVGQRYPELESIEGGHEGDDHAFPIFYNAQEAVSIDISPYVYERGGGFNWKKISNVTFEPEHIKFTPQPREYIYDI